MSEVIVSPKRGARQKTMILNRTRALFWEKGYQKTSMKDIARVCGFEVSNIYNYFRGKEQLLYDVLREEVAGMVSSLGYLETDDAGNPVEQLRVLIKTHVAFALGYRRTFGLLSDTGLRDLSPAHRKKIIELRDAYDRILCKVIRRGIDTGDFAEIDEKLACNVIASMVVRTRIWFHPEGRLSSEEVADFIAEFALNALRGGKQGRLERRGYEAR